MKTKKVTMGLAERDLANVEYLQSMLHSRSKASAVGQSLDLAKFLVEAKKRGNKIIIADENGEQKEVVIPGLQE